MTYPSGRTVSFTRNNTGRITGVTTKETSAAASATLASNVVWQAFGGSGQRGGVGGSGNPLATDALPVSEPAGRGNGVSQSSGHAPVSFPVGDELIGGGALLKSLNHGNGLSLWRSYDTDNLISEIGLYDNSTTPKTARIQRIHGMQNNHSLTHVWDNLTPSENQSFWLSVAGRLQNADGPWGQDVYNHDGVGNRTSFSRTLSGVTTARTYGYGATNNLNFDVRIGAAFDRVMNYDAHRRRCCERRSYAEALSKAKVHTRIVSTSSFMS